MPIAQSYKVKPTDTLSKLGNPQEILRMNPGLGKLSMGQVIKIPQPPKMAGPMDTGGPSLRPGDVVNPVKKADPIRDLINGDAELQRITRLISGGVANPLILDEARNYINNLVTTNRSIDANLLYQYIGLAQNATPVNNAVANTFNWRL